MTNKPVQGKKRNVLKITLIVFFALLIILNVLLLAAGNYYYEQACRIDAREGRTNQFVLQPGWEKVFISSRFGYKMAGIYVTNARRSENTIILVHGRAMDKWNSMEQYSKLFFRLGFNVLAYDCRAHGESGGKDITFGFYEKFDLDSWVDFVKSKNPKGIIGIHGESMGAATALQHSELNEKSKKVCFYISDCSYSDLRQLFKYILKRDYNLPSFPLLDYASFVSFFRSGFTFDQVSPIRAIKSVKVPILFIHGGKDDYVPTEMSKELFETKSGKKELWLVPNAGHAKSISIDPAGYQKTVEYFVNFYAGACR
jgi:fermentation-respiration switch protein FrsA (DUF1100 family)